MYESIQYKGYTIKVNHDEEPLNPRKEFDCHNGQMVCWHRRYNLGDDHDYRDFEDFACSYLGMDDDKFYNKFNGDYDAISDALEKAGIIMLPLYLYDHSGITMNTGGFSCGWDSGQVGFVWTDMKRLQDNGHTWKKWTKARKEQVTSWLESEVEEFDNYITGNVFCYEVVDDNDDSIDSCGGFYGSDFEESGLLEFARSSVDFRIREDLKKEKEQRQSRFDKIKQYIRSSVPLQYRFA